MKYNIHKAINLRGNRKGLVDDSSLNFIFKQFQFGLASSVDEFNQRDISPPNTYGTYYPNVYGKKHSQYNN